MPYASWSVVFGEQPSAAKWNILGTNDAYFDSVAGASSVTTSYTPTFANTTLGNGTVTGRYAQIGKQVDFWARFVLGSTSAVSSTPTVTLPVTADSNYTAAMQLIGQVQCTDTGTADYDGPVRYASSTTGLLLVDTVSGTYGTETGLSSTTPFVWGNGDAITVTGSFFAASGP